MVQINTKQGNFDYDLKSGKNIESMLYVESKDMVFTNIFFYFLILSSNLVELEMVRLCCNKVMAMAIRNYYSLSK